ncbi:hypothetical protein [Martelella soudanensis]|uniref:hypothetical protein n=1 Tax=unclassified Martelella TaxID=2629616 RepID=UPI001AEEA071|nr:MULTISPECIES: hypothetical protein [unclassified Martelella]
MRRSFLNVARVYHKRGQHGMSDHDIHSGIAALSICEALLLALNVAQVLPESEIMGVLKDAAAAHENAEGTKADRKMHVAVAALINRIIAGGNSVRRS